MMKMTDLMVKMYVINKIGELAKTAIYRSEIVNAGKAGLEKFNAVVEKFCIVGARELARTGGWP